MVLLEIVPIGPHPRAALGIQVDGAGIQAASPAGVADWEALQGGRGDAWRDAAAIIGVRDREREEGRGMVRAGCRRSRWGGGGAVVG
jgi:hypothetical protein